MCSPCVIISRGPSLADGPHTRSVGGVPAIPAATRRSSDQRSRLLNFSEHKR
jgi:hypothetical protein